MTSSTLPLPGGPARPRRALPTGTAQCGALLCVLLINALVADNFFAIHVQDGRLFGSLIDILNRCAPVALLSLGMTLVIATGGIDLSVGAVMAISGATMASLATGGHSLPVIFAAVIGVGLLCGLWNGLLVAVFKIQPIVATLILMVAGRGIAQLITDGQIITIYYTPYFFMGGGYLAGLPFSVFVVAAVFVVLYLAITRTALGLFIQAVGINPTAARVAGVQAGRLIVAAYVFCGVCAGIAGLLISSNVKSADGNNAGQLLELDAILAVTLGGTALTGGRFSLVGSVIGALIIQTLTYAIYSLGVPPEINLVVKAVVVFIVMLLQSPEFRAQVGALARRPGAGALQ